MTHATDDAFAATTTPSRPDPSAPPSAGADPSATEALRSRPGAPTAQAFRSRPGVRASTEGTRPSGHAPAPRLTLCEFPASGFEAVESLSPYCLKVRRALVACDLPFVSRRAFDPGAFRRLNPTGQAPVLLIDDEAVADSTRILARIVSLAPRRLNAGLDARARAEAHVWEEFADGFLNGFLTAARWADPRNWPAVRRAYFGGAPWFVRTLVVPIIRRRVTRALVARDVLRAGPAACWASYEAALGALEERAPRDGFWLSDGISTADLALFGQLQALRTPLTPWQHDRLRECGRLVDYLDRVDAATRPR